MSHDNKLAPFVPTLLGAVREALKIAKLKPKELLIDIGSGDGRVPIIAAREFGARAIGIELSQARHIEAKERLAEAKILHKLQNPNQPFPAVELIHDDALLCDISLADVIYIYLRTEGNEMLKEKFLRELKPTARIISASFKMPDWTISEQKHIHIYDHTRIIYIYRMSDQR